MEIELVSKHFSTQCNEFIVEKEICEKHNSWWLRSWEAVLAGIKPAAHANKETAAASEPG